MQNSTKQSVSETNKRNLRKRVKVSHICIVCCANSDDLRLSPSRRRTSTQQQCMSASMLIEQAYLQSSRAETFIMVWHSYRLSVSSTSIRECNLISSRFHVDRDSVASNDQSFFCQKTNKFERLRNIE